METESSNALFVPLLIVFVIVAMLASFGIFFFLRYYRQKKGGKRKPSKKGVIGAYDTNNIFLRGRSVDPPSFAKFA